MKKIFVALMSLLIVSSSTAFATSEVIDVDTNPNHYASSWHSQSDYPALQPLEITTVWLKFKNEGTATWYNSGDNPVRLGTSHDIDRSSVFYKHTWLSENRPAKLKESKVEPGEVGTFSFYLKAPETPGIYKEFFQPVVEGITWLEDWGVFLEIDVEGSSEIIDEPTGTTNSCEWHSQSGYLTLNPGEAQKVWVKYKNTGDTIWYNYGDNPTRLGTSNPLDRNSGFVKHTWLSSNRPTSLKETQVKPGEYGTFEFYAEAPDTSGEFKEYFRPVIEGITWLNDVGLYWTFTVTGDSDPSPTPNENYELTGYVENGKVKLDWDSYYAQTLTSSSEEISGYKVVRSETKTNPTYPEDWWVYLSGTSTTEYTDSSVYPGHTYYYRVGAYKSGSGVIEYTNNIQLTITDDINQNDDFVLLANNQSNGIKLDWSRYYVSTQTSSTAVDGYKLLKSTSNSSPVYPDHQLIYISGETNTAYIDTDAIDNQKYYYRVGAYKDGSVIAYSNVVTIVADTDKYETGESLALTTSNQSDGIKLYWNEYTSNDIDGYKIMRSTSDSSPTYPDEYYKYISGYTNTVYTDSNTSQNQGYYYRVGAYKDGSVLSYSNTVYIISDHDNNAEEITLEATNVNGGIDLDWSQYDDSSVSGYKILRSTSNSNPTYDGTYYKYLSNYTSTGYVDTNTSSGTRYFYRIGVYRNGEVISYSNTVEITAS